MLVKTLLVLPLISSIAVNTNTNKIYVAGDDTKYLRNVERFLLQCKSDLIETHNNSIIMPAYLQRVPKIEVDLSID